jgi:glycosyltransferase involved in cell wall biosynthesis
MAAGLPIVTSPNSGTLTRDGVHGFVRNYDDVEGMAQAVERLATNPTLRQEMGEASRRTAERCTLESYGQQLTDVFLGKDRGVRSEK